MIKINVPGWKTLQLNTIVFDYNGTLAIDGIISQNLKNRLCKLAEKLSIYVITADTFGSALEQLKGIPVKVEILGSSDQVNAKSKFVDSIGASRTVTVGNGANDVGMHVQAALAIGVMGHEGIFKNTFSASDIVVSSPEDAIDLLLKEKRLIATLRQ